MATTKITKVQRFEDIKALLTGEAATHGTTIEDALAFADKEIALLSKKNTSSSKKETALQKENAVYMERIKEYLASLDEGARVRCSEIRRAVEGLDAFDTPKTTALMGKLAKAGEVVRTELKGVAYFSLA